jgi:quercetin dioxygenase-like cupin family protein
VAKLPNEIEYKGLTGDLPTAVLYGDPTKPGPFVTRMKIPAGIKVMPHWNPDEAHTVTVLSGTWYYAVGEQWDEAKLTAYPAGSFLAEPPKTPHYSWAKDGEVVLQITGIGPTGAMPAQAAAK